MTDAQFAILVTTTAGLVTTLGTFGYNIYRDNRNRRWDLENRRLAREEVISRIDENTQISVQAFKEANDVNAKIATLTKQFYDVALAENGEPTKNVLERVDENTKQTIEILRGPTDEGPKRRTS